MFSGHKSAGVIVIKLFPGHAGVSALVFLLFQGHASVSVIMFVMFDFYGTTDLLLLENSLRWTQDVPERSIQKGNMLDMRPVRQLLLRWRFLPAPVVDNSSHGRPTLQVLKAQCYQITTMKGPAVWYQQAKVSQSGYAQTEHLSTCVAVMACQHGACCVLAATPNTRPQQCGVAEPQ